MFETERNDDEPHDSRKKYMCTFPYPYMNGRLHLGHAFTITKADFSAGFHRLLGENTLFPFSFHCTGMPIQAAANTLARELEGEFKRDKPKAPEVERDVVPGKFKGKKTKAKAKTGINVTQHDIMRKMGIPEEEIPAFKDPLHWLEYFPPYAQSDLMLFGAHVDWRRSFITTSVNPYYDSFIRWQFNSLRAAGKIAFGKRPTIYSPRDGQACMDHDRKTGEGVNPQGYTLIKIRVTGEFTGDLAPLAGRDVFLVAATLRPETMYGQTNCFVKPNGTYGAFEANDGEVFVCSEKSAINMSYQDLTPEFGKPKCLCTFKGQAVIGMPLKAPLATYDVVYALPLLTIDMKKGTGVVTSVPSDAPDDYQALKDLQTDEKMRNKYSVTEEMVAPFEVVEIIEIPEFGRRSAAMLCEKMKVKSQHDKAKLKTIKDQVYLKGFYEGVMLVGVAEGKNVQDAKPIVRQYMIDNNMAAAYYEPESEVISRSGDVCVVAQLDQWYLKYGEDSWKDTVEAHIESDSFQAYTNAAQLDFRRALGWLREWACSRSFGLGTLLPWDTQFVIESLSDSTIYMAYYTISHKMQGCVDGSKPGSAGIAADQMGDAEWEFIFKDGPYPEGCTVPEATLVDLRKDFNYWYPMDLRVSGKDLIFNHLTMALYNHAAMWGGRSDRMPQSFFVNGHVLVDGEKMSKSRGNFLTLKYCIDTFSADATRLALAYAGDSLEDPNFERKTANDAVLWLTQEQRWAEEALGHTAPRSAGTVYEAESPNGHAEAILEARISQAIRATHDCFSQVKWREGLKCGFFDMQIARDQYRDMCQKGKRAQNQKLLRRFIEAQVLLLAPICPHWAETMWMDTLKNTTSVMKALWPEASAFDPMMLRKDDYLRRTVSRLRKAIDSGVTRGVVNDSCIIYTASEFPEWQQAVIKTLAESFNAEDNSFPKTVMKAVSKVAAKGSKRQKKNIMSFASARKKEAEANGAGGLTLEALPFDESALLTENLAYIAATLNVKSVEVYVSTDEGIPDPAGRAEGAEPGTPAMYVYVK